MIVDVFTYNGEADLLEIRLNILNDYVDQFIIVEAPTTFSGREKPLYFEKVRHTERFRYYYDKIKYHVVDESYTDEEIALAKSSPNTGGAAHWEHEFLQKESIKKALTHLKDDDIVFIGDVDEVWEPGTLVQDPYDNVWKLPQLVYVYWLNNKSSEEWRGTIYAKYGTIKEQCLNHARTSGWLTDGRIPHGWHFTSMGGYEEVKRKLESSYTRDSYWTEGVESNLEQNIKENKDFLGRGFTYTIDENEWPQYLKDNKEHYKYLLK